MDPTHSNVTFSVKHLMVATVRGRFPDVSGTIEYDPTAASVAVPIDVTAIDTGTEQRDGHLRSADFFDVANHPTMTFRSTRIEVTGDAQAKIHGDLTIRGTTRPVVLDGTLVAVVTGMQGERRAAFEASTKIDRAAWGLTWNVALESGGWLVSKDVRIELEIAAVEAAAARPPPRASPRGHSADARPGP
ncbi:MAG: YceI family protein [Chloroflexota bacterium]